MRPLGCCQSLLHRLARLGIIGAAPALLLVLTNGILDLVHPAGPPTAPIVLTGAT
jgi:hypothetical protein